MNNPYLVCSDRELRALPTQWLLAERWEKVGSLLADINFAEAKNGRVGIDELIQDYTTALRLLKKDNDWLEKLKAINRVLDRQAHGLRNWNLKEQPAFFLQQFRNLSFKFGYEELRLITEKLLAQRNLEFLRERFITGRDSSANLRTISCHTGSVTCVAITPDSQFAVSGSDDDTFKVWEFSTGQITQTVNVHRKYAVSLKAVIITPDGRSAVSSTENDLMLWELSTGKVIWNFSAHSNQITALAITPDGQLIVSGASDNTIKIWHLETGRLLQILEGHTATIRSIVVTPDGRHILSGSNNNTIKIWDLKTGENIRTFYSYFASPDGQYIFSRFDNLTMMVWDLGAELNIQKLNDYFLRIEDCSFLVGSDNGTMTVEDAINRRYLGTIDVNFNDGDSYTFIIGLAVSADENNLVAITQDGILTHWNLETGQARITYVDSVLEIAFTKDKRFAVFGSWDGQVKVLNLSTGQIARSFGEHTERITSIAITSDDRYAVSGSADHTIKVWDLENSFTGVSVEQISHDKYHNQRVEDIFFVPNSHFLISRSYDDFKVWDLLTGETVHSKAGTAITLLPNSHHTIFASDDEVLTIWDPISDKVLGKLDGFATEVYSISIPPDGQLAVSCSMENGIKVWNLQKGNQIYSLDVNMVPSVDVTRNRMLMLDLPLDDDEALPKTKIKVYDLYTGQFIDSIEPRIKITPSGLYAISDSFATNLKVWNLDNVQIIKELPDSTDPIRSFQITSDGRSIVYISDDDALKIWDLGTGQQIIVLQCKGSYDLWLAPDDRTAIIGSYDGDLSVCDLTLGKITATLKGHTSRVWKAFFSSVDHYLLTVSSGDRTIRVWDIDTGREILVIWCDFKLWCLVATPDFHTIIAGDELGAVHFFDWVKES